MLVEPEGRVQKHWQEEGAANMDADEMNAEERALLGKIRARRRTHIQEHREKKALQGGNSVMPRSKHHESTLSDMRQGLESMGMDASKAVRSASRVGRKRERSSTAAREGAGGDVAMAGADDAVAKRVHSSRSRSMSRGAQSVLARGLLPRACVCLQPCYTTFLARCPPQSALTCAIQSKLAQHARSE